MNIRRVKKDVGINQVQSSFLLKMMLEASFNFKLNLMNP